MAVSRDKLFNSIRDGAAWDAGVVFNRTNAIPIDKFSVFSSYTDAEDYAARNPVAYPGQLIAVVPASGTATSYIILADGTLKELGVDIELSSTVAELGSGVTELKNTIKDAIVSISNKGSSISYKKVSGTEGTFNTTFVGTREDFNTAYAAGNITIGTIVLITDEEDDIEPDEPTNDEKASPKLGTGALGYLVLG